MQCTFLLALVISCLTLSVAAAPIGVADLTTTPENLARSPLPEPVEIARTPEPEPGCKITYNPHSKLAIPTQHHTRFPPPSLH
ncbi:hypothetical protein B0H16DRAFT_1718754 [Mycena metata]|uniref:Uncharacterized protein n=1 Tax=Mycena metata TaxID=1033252 RepID=A0AAD7NJI7_9AGAR|nr:hypothetical protein B0H16DRAFT_1718754 [Mycena metata]